MRVKSCSATILWKAAELYSHVMLIVLLMQCGCNILVRGSNHAVCPFFEKLLNSTLLESG